MTWRWLPAAVDEQPCQRPLEAQTGDSSETEATNVAEKPHLAVVDVLDSERSTPHGLKRQVN